MQTKPTIDGVSRCRTCRGAGWIDNLRTVGAPAAKCPDCAPAVERQELEAPFYISIDDWNLLVRGDIAIANARVSRAKRGEFTEPLYAAPPAPVAALWEIRIPDEPQNPESPVEYFYAQNAANRDLLLMREGATVVAEYASLDATAALNTSK